jgi:hypothetical protein
VGEPRLRWLEDVENDLSEMKTKEQEANNSEEWGSYHKGSQGT